MIEDIAANLIWRTAIKVMIICLFKVYCMWFYLVFDRWKWNYNFSLHEYRNNPTHYKLKDPLHFLQLPCFYIWSPYQASLRYAYKVGRSYHPGIFFKALSKYVKDLYLAPTRSALPSSSILKIINIGKCELYSEKYSYQWNLWA